MIYFHLFFHSFNFFFCNIKRSGDERLHAPQFYRFLFIRSHKSEIMDAKKVEEKEISKTLQPIYLIDFKWEY